MSNEKRNVETEEIKEARELTEKELAQVTGGRGPAHILESAPEPLDIHFKFYNDPPAL